MQLPPDLLQPTHDFSVMPFWFWNDDLDERELLRQIDDFVRHGVHGFVIHPRVGLPRTLGWMSPALLRFYRIAIDEARRRRMRVMLYDEGMYPSGSSSGQVVAENPAFACRCLAKLDLPEGTAPALGQGHELVAVVPRRNGRRVAIVARAAGSVIRGLHYLGEGPDEETPPAADLLNPDAVACFLRHVYDGFAREFAADFGQTIIAIFTDEPSLLGRGNLKGVWPGTNGILPHIHRLLGYDFTPHLPALWYDDEPDAARFRADFSRAIRQRLEETYYAQLSAWCASHQIALTGHPCQSDDLGPLRHFQLPGQDLVWRWVLPDSPTALEGQDSTQGKCSASAMLHAGRRRNLNECCGAYGHELTWDEMQWLARWCFVRGVNLLVPHAFYYSVRGPRRDERPPDVGPNSAWWPRYHEYADACRRLSWLNTDCEHVCDLAILGTADHLPWRAAKACFQHQRDFNYLEERDLLDRATIDATGIRIAGMHYQAIITEHTPSPAVQAALAPMVAAGRVFLVEDAEIQRPTSNAHRPTSNADTPALLGRWTLNVERWALKEPTGAEPLLPWLDRVAPSAFRVQPAARALRVRHVRKCGFDAFLLFNEEQAPLTLRIDLPAKGARFLFDPASAQLAPLAPDAPLSFGSHTLLVVLAPA
jgi:hypothetical protein